MKLTVFLHIRIVTKKNCLLGGKTSKGGGGLAQSKTSYIDNNLSAATEQYDLNSRNLFLLLSNSHICPMSSLSQRFWLRPLGGSDVSAAVENIKRRNS